MRIKSNRENPALTYVYITPEHFYPGLAVGITTVKTKKLSSNDPTLLDPNLNRSPKIRRNTSFDVKINIRDQRMRALLRATQTIKI